MPRKRIPIVAGDPYHITARCINKEWFTLPLEVVWKVMEDHLYLLHHGFKIDIHGFVLMSNHFHLLLTAPNGNLSEALLYFMRETSKEISRLTGRINQTYGCRNHKTWITTYHHYLNTYKYLFQNPLRAGICQRAEDYPYSTLSGLLGSQKLIIPIADQLLLNPTLDSSTLTWLNRRPSLDHEREMRLALKRPKFELKTSRVTGQPSALEVQLL